jgi:hypothetical protein
VPNVTNISIGVSPDLTWASRPGASCPRFSFLGTIVPAAGTGTGIPAVAAHAVSRVRGRVVFVVPPKTPVTAAQLGQPNIHNYMTRVNADGEGASGPPGHREPV